MPSQRAYISDGLGISAADQRVGRLENSLRDLQQTVADQGGPVTMSDVNTVGQIAALANTRALTNDAFVSQHTADIEALQASRYFMKTALGTQYQGFTETVAVGQSLPAMQEQFETSNPYFGDWDSDTNKWTCPATGHYKINVNVAVEGVPADILRNVLVHILKRPVGAFVDTTIAEGGKLMGGQHQSEGDKWYINANVLDEIQVNDQIEFKLSYAIQPEIEGSSTALLVLAKYTCADITRL